MEYKFYSSYTFQMFIFDFFFVFYKIWVHFTFNNFEYASKLLIFNIFFCSHDDRINPLPNSHLLFLLTKQFMVWWIEEEGGIFCCAESTHLKLLSNTKHVIYPLFCTWNRVPFSGPRKRRRERNSSTHKFSYTLHKTT